MERIGKESKSIYSSSDSDDILCNPCSDKVQSNKASFYCLNCEEYLCERCNKRHKDRKATRDHAPIAIQEYNEIMNTKQFQCDPCKEEDNDVPAETFCNLCDEQLCNNCSNDHRKRKATKDHALFSIREKIKKELELSRIFCTICKEDHKNVRAEFFCDKCDEYLCCVCSKRHTIRKATKVHDLTKVKEIQMRQTFSQFTCDECDEENKATTAAGFCNDCSEYLCSLCSEKHNSRKASKSHIIEVIKAEDKELLFCTKCEVRQVQNVSAFYCNRCHEHLCQPCARKHKTNTKTETHEMISSLKFLEKKKNRKTCNPCDLQNVVREAISFCIACEEYLCDMCDKQHKVKKVTKNHEIVKITNMDEDFKKNCDLCYLLGKENESESFCDICEDFLCKTCVQAHSVQKATKDHTLENIFVYRNKKRETEITSCDVCINQDVTVAACTYCKECQEKLCKSCTRIHQTQKATKIHNLISADTTAFTITKQATLGKPTLLEALGDKVTIKWETDAEKKSSISHFEIRYRKTGETKWQVTSTDDSKDIGTVEGLQENGTYEFKVRPVFYDGEGPYGPVSDNITIKTPRPGKPEVVTVKTDSITIKWKKPEGGNLLIKSYDIKLRMVGEDQWRVTTTLNAEQVFTVKELKGSTKYEFQVRAVYDDMKGQYGPTSDEIETEISLARKLKSFAKQIPGKLDDGNPKRYKVPIAVDEKSVNLNAKFRRCIFGTKTDISQQEKTIMLIGAKGSGKSTLIDGMINYIFDVAWDDEFRYSLIDLMQDEEKKSEDQALSQTEWITNYTINHTDGCQIYYTLNVIDTPGFGDTRGTPRDKEIVEQMRELFATRGDKGISTIDAVCFITQAPLARLSPTQKYIFESILSLFGRDIKENTFILITFADGNKPPVLDALAKAEIPFVDKFVFNNSALFASKQAEFAQMFWKMGKESFKKFFKHLCGAKTKSLQMSSADLNERNHLETTVQGLRPQISDGLNKLEVLRQTWRILKQHLTDVEANKNFIYEVKETCQRRIDLDVGVFVTNCLVCNRTCHFPCHIATDDKSACSAMKEGNCTVCPKNCSWDSHNNHTYRFETYTAVMKRTYVELKKNYESVTGKAQTSRQLLQSVKNDFNMLRKKVGKMVEEVRKSLNRLSEIALKPNPLSNCEYIDLLIETEKQEGKIGFQSRITMLYNLRKDAELLQIVPDGNFVWSEVDISDIVGP